ncbi:MAG: hypothetical protein GY775_06565 [Candidatus Scalindua sp.]|nr:hypothetical protein [Candidatus Scalindua sp.]
MSASTPPNKLADRRVDAILAGSIMLVEPKRFGSGCKPEPATATKSKCFRGVFSFLTNPMETGS